MGELGIVDLDKYKWRMFAKAGRSSGGGGGGVVVLRYNKNNPVDCLLSPAIRQMKVVLSSLGSGGIATDKFLVDTEDQGR